MTSQTEDAVAFLTRCAAGDVQAAYDRHVAPAFVHHNAHFPSDRQSLLDAMAASSVAEPNKSFTVRQTIEQGDRVAVMSELHRENADLHYAVVHIVRFENGLIAEMWDMGQEVPKDSPNELGMF